MKKTYGSWRKYEFPLGEAWAFGRLGEKYNEKDGWGGHNIHLMKSVMIHKLHNHLNEYWWLVGNANKYRDN